jgi:hypothetical protein
MDEDKSEGEQKSAQLWWEDRRFLYNKGLFMALVISYLCYAGAILLGWHSPQFIFSALLPNVVAIILFVGIANILYCYTPLLEWVLLPSDTAVFRHKAFRFLYWFSILVPLMVSLGVSALAIFLAIADRLWA